MPRLENKIAVITGATSGFGLATARLFADEGAQLALFLASDESSYCTGTTFPIDGGMSAS